MKAKDFNGTIKVYNQVPKSYNNIIGFQYLSDSDLESHGFYDVVTPTYNSNTQELGDIYFDSANNQFTYPVNSKTFSQTVAQMKTAKIAQLKSIYNRKLSETDWYVTRKSEKGTAIPSDVQTERDQLRTDCATHESSINAKTTKNAVANYDLPSLMI